MINDLSTNTLRQEAYFDCHRGIICHPQPLQHENVLFVMNLQFAAEKWRAWDEFLRQDLRTRGHITLKHVLGETGQAGCILVNLILADKRSLALHAVDQPFALQPGKRATDHNPADMEPLP